MNRSAKGLLGAAVVAPFAAVLAVASAPANAAHTPAEAVPGPSTQLLYDAAAAAHPISETVPAPVVRTGGQAAERATGAVDGALRSAPGATGAAYRTAAVPAPPKSGGADGGGADGGALLKKLGDTVGQNAIGDLPGAQPALPGARHAGMPVSMAAPGGPQEALPADVTNVPAALGAVEAAGVPIGSVLFPPRERRATPVPSDDVLGQTNDAVNKAGVKLDETQQGVGNVVDVLKAKGAAERRADGPAPRPAAGPLEGGPLDNGPLAGPVSMVTSTALGQGAVPGIG
ncbi:hypothetical protein HUT06_42255 [Actinomadura sp. NAK00032]|uniref:hypothetical protein n=1 Tax=Actinomadura sp. NAK00032 TaxID=2742128 RepID=UPI001591C417|nr:hypothetical protein [Actinomadura sp. NAK00032]QKW39839.1 hypothetical protein HUT06_42255 [Actinomadura sp. NAK00032]